VFGLTPFGLSCILNAILAFSLGLYVRLNAPQKNLNRTFGTLGLFVGLWSLGLGLMVSSHEHAAALLWMHLHYLGCLFIPPAYLHFAVSLLGAQKTHKPIVAIAYSVSVGLLALNITGFLVSDAIPKYEFRYYTQFGPLYGLFPLSFGAFIGYAHVLLLRGFWKASGKRRTQIKWVLLSSVIGFVGGSSTFLPVFNIGGLMERAYILNYASGAYPLMIAYAIMRYRIMNIEILVKRSLVFAVVVVLLLDDTKRSTGRGTPYGPVEDVIGNRDFSDIVENRGDLDLPCFLRRQTEEPGNRHGPVHEPGAVRTGCEVFQIQKLNQSTERGKRDVANLLFQVFDLDIFG